MQEAALDRRRFLGVGTGASAGFLLRSKLAGQQYVSPAGSGLVEISLTAASTWLSLAGRQALLYSYNAQVPGPLIEARAGDTVRLRLRNELPEPTNLHYHGRISARKAKLIVITSDLVSARITAQVEGDSDVLTTPKIATDETGSYVVYVEGFEMSGMGLRNSDDQDSAVTGEKILYAFRPDGTLKFKVKLSEAQVGMTPR